MPRVTGSSAFADDDNHGCMSIAVGMKRSQRLAAQELRHLADEAGRLADEEMLERRQAVDQAEADVAREAQDLGAVREQPVEAVGGHPHRHGVEATPALIALQRGGSAVVESEPRGV